LLFGDFEYISDSFYSNLLISTLNYCQRYFYYYDFEYYWNFIFNFFNSICFFHQ